MSEKLDVYQKIGGVGVPLSAKAGQALVGDAASAGMLEQLAELQASLTALQADVTSVRELAGKGKAPNTELWVTESGTFTAPVGGLYKVTCINGGNGGYVNNTGDVCTCYGGNSGKEITAFVYLSEGQEVSVTIGAGGQPLVTTTGQASSLGAGGVTSFGEITPNKDNSFRRIAMSELLTSSGYDYISGVGVGGGRGAGYGKDAPVWYGAGGGSYYHRDIPESSTPSATAGADGVVHLCFYNPENEPTSSQNPSEGE